MGTKTRLGIMMFLQFFVWGAWYTSIAVYMTAEGMGDLTHWPFTVNPIAAIAAPFFLGLVADRYFSTEKVLGVLHVLGGLVLLTVPQFSGAPVVFVLLLLLYNLCFMPTLGLANSLAFHNIADQEKQFPLIRVFGTIGWIVAGLFVSLVLRMFMTGGSLPEQTPLPLYTAAVTSLVLGLYSFSLPHTPPPAAGERVSVRSILGLDALKALGSRPFYVFLGASLLISIPLAAYYNFTQLFLEATGFQNIAGTQTLGQMSEVIFMLLMPLFFVRLGVKWMLVAGMGAWALRYVFFALAAPSGVGQAQGMLVLVTYGLGMLIGAQAAGNLFNAFLGDAGALTLGQWQEFWFVPAAFAAVIMVGFALLFNDRVDRPRAEGTDDQAA